MSTISAGTTISTALVNAGDTTGALQLQVNGTTPSVTLAANGAIGVGSTPSYGISGQVLVSGGSAAAPTWSTGGNFGADLSYVDYTLTTSTAINIGASAIYSQSVSLDGTSELLIIYGTASAHAVVYNTSTSTFGTPTIVRTANLGCSVRPVALAKISSTAVLICSLPSATALETVVLTVSGSTITVGTALATTLAANSVLITPNTRLVTVGSSYVLNYYTTADSLPKFRAITVSGSTPSIGSELAYAGGTQTTMHHSYAQSASVLLHFSMTANTTIYAFPISVSGTVLSAGTQATVATTNPNYFVTGALSGSRYALAYINTTGRGAVVSVAGSVASISTAATTMAVSTYDPTMQVFGNQAFIANGLAGADTINVITDTGGVATLGTDVTPPVIGRFVGYLSTSKVLFAPSATGNSAYYQYGISSGSPVLEKSFLSVTSQSVVTVQVPGPDGYGSPLSGPPQSGSVNSVILRTATGKIAVGSSGVLSFAVSIDATSPAKLQQSANPFTTFNDGISDAVAWGIPSSQAAGTTTVQLRKVTLL